MQDAEGGGAMNPSCSPMMSMSVFCPASKTLSLLVEGLPARRAVILKKGPKTAVSRTKPRAFAAAASSSRVTGGGPDDALARLAARRARREGTGGAGVHRIPLAENDEAAACCVMRYGADLSASLAESRSFVTSTPLFP